MNFIPDIELGIVEYRQIIKSIQEQHGFDFSDYALTSLKRRFELIISKHNLKHAEGLIDRLKENKSFFDIFLSEILVASTEMFRDPSFWAYLRDEFFPSVIRDYSSTLRIWLPDSVSGDELFTLMIVIHESKLENNIEVITTLPSDKLIEQVKTGLFVTNKFETSRDNYARYQGKADFNNYITLRNEKYYRDISLIKNVKFLKQNINFDTPPQDFKLIIYRNKMLYINQNLQDKVLKKLSEALTTNGFLVIGNKEQLGMVIAKSYRLINEAENVFKRI